MAQSPETYTCERCKTEFTITSGGFIGSLDDFEFIKTKGDIEKEVEGIECSPFLSYIELCANCYKTEIEND
jgi:hypothetical protein